MTHIVIEEDHFLKIVPVMLDPDTIPEHQRAVADFYAHDIPDFPGWCGEYRKRVPGLYPARVTFAHSQEEFEKLLETADAAVVESFRVTDAALARAKNLKIVHKFGALMHNIDAEACARHGIPLYHVKRACNVAVAEQAFALMMALSKRILELAGNVKADTLTAAGYPIRPYDRRYIGGSNYARIPNLKTLMGATLGIVGMGEVGRDLAKWARAFDMDVLYYQRTKLSAEEEAGLGSYAALHDLLARSDYIVVQLPLNASTRGIIGRAELEKVKPGAMLINVARAELVDHVALVDALTSGRLGGLGLDVGYSEPAKPDDPLLQFKDGNVILMPHTAIGHRRVGLADLEALCLNIWREVTRQ